MKNFNETIVEDVSSTVYLGASITLGFIGFFGCTMNLMVAIIIVIDARLVWTPINMILFNLVLGDFLVAVLGNPVAMVSAINQGWYWSHNMCLWYAWFMSTLGLASIGNLTVMAIERCILITQPMKTLSIRRAVFLIIGVWIYALSLSLPPLFNWGSYGFEAANISCSVSWEVHDPATRSDSYIAFLFIFGLIIPVLAIIISYSLILTTTMKISKRTGNRSKREAKVTRMVALMISAFLFAWTPYAAFALAAQYFDVKPSAAMGVLPALLAKTSICYNPIIYVGLNSHFRRYWKRNEKCRTTGTSASGSQQTALNTIKQ